ncbi:MAG: Rieske 2Fe-2S domain-containing protein [Beijerinckiaceae bacterium]|nr:Rieske 2Fe-2S domain-containing protein [Beijerinckiaceae bacterium]
MAQEQALGPAAQIPKGEGRTFDVCGRQVAVFHTRAGELFAIEAVCPHRGGPLADGLTGSDTVLCPLHERAFDLRTGAGIGHEDCVTPFPLRLGQDGTLFITLGGPAS